MLETFATGLSWALLGYLAAGVLFAIPFVVRGVQQIDPAASISKPGFRLMILPGAVALWPLLLTRWALGRQPPEERSPHRRTAGS